MEKRKLERFIKAYFGVVPTITFLPNGGYIVTWGYLEDSNNYKSFRTFDIRVAQDGTWQAWTRYAEEAWRPVKGDYEYWYLFIKPGDTSGIQLAIKLCSLMGAKFEAYQEPTKA